MEHYQLKRFVSLATMLCLLLLSIPAWAEEAPIAYQGEGTLKSGVRWTANDAQVYGSGTYSVDTLTVKVMDLGKKPEDTLDISLFFSKDEQYERLTGWTAFDVTFEGKDGKHVSVYPGSLAFWGTQYERMERYAYLFDDYTQQAMGVEFPDSLPSLTPTEAQTICQPIMDAFGMEYGAAIDVRAYTKETVEKVCAVRLKELKDTPSWSSEVEADLKAPKTQADGLYTLTIPQYIHDIRIAPYSRSLAKYHFQEGNCPGGVRVLIDAQGDIQSLQTCSWLDMPNAKVTDTNAPIPYEQATQTALASLDKLWYSQTTPKPDNEVQVKEVRLEYVLVPDKAVKNAKFTAIPVWSIYLNIHEERQADSIAFGLLTYYETEYVLAIDARTGKVITR